MPVPIVSLQQMRAWEAATWAAGVSQSQVIEEVGRLVGERLLSLTGPGTQILVLAGKGHNGDDARAAASHLSDRNVRLMNVKEPGAALAQLAAIPDAAGSWIIDGLFGIGLSRPLEGAWVELIETINRRCARILAIDIPSGLDAEEGVPRGAAIRASLTLTLAGVKPGLLRAAAAEYVGRLETVADIGLIPCPLPVREGWTTKDDFPSYPPVRPINSHKGTFGHLAIIAGSLGYHGAAVLAARGALSSRPGLVTVLTTERAYPAVAAQLQAAMVRPWQAGCPLPESSTALLFGPGLAGEDVDPALKTELVKLWNEWPHPVVADASGLDWLTSHATARQTPAWRVITPHPGEAARMLGTETSDVQADRVSAVLSLSRRFGDCVVVLKGHQTLVGRHPGPVSYNSSGNPDLAQGGSGDLLAGLIAGLWAQPRLQADLELAVRFGVWRHGDAADRLTERRPGWTISGLAEVLEQKEVR